MAENLSVEEALTHVLELARRAGEADVDVVGLRSESLSVHISEGRVEKVAQSAGVSLGVRVLQGGRTGLASSERLQPADLERAFSQARENARWQDATEVVMLDAAGEIPAAEGLGKYNPALEDLELETLTRFGLETEAAVRQADQRVRSIPFLAVSRGMRQTCLASSHGLHYTTRSNQVGAGCHVLVEEGERRKSGGYGWSAREWQPGQAAQIAQQAVERATSLLPARPLATAKIPVVLDEYTAPSVMGLYLGAFDAEAVQKGLSRLQGRLGEQIAVPWLQLHDEPHRPGAPGSRYLDGEGVLTQPRPLIAEGHLATFLHHVETARKDGLQPTGHAVRSAQSGISASPHNLIMPTGAHTLAELCAQHPRCLLVTELEGASGCNSLSGDISIGVQGMLYEQGQPSQPVEAVTIAGNFFDLLMNIQACGNCYQPNLSSLFIPPLLINGFSLSG